MQRTIEREKMLCDIANRLCKFFKTQQKDLLEIVEADIKGWDVLYIWEPIKDNEQAKQFIYRLVTLLDCNQTIFIVYQDNSFLVKHLECHPDIQLLERLEGGILFHRKVS